MFRFDWHCPFCDRAATITPHSRVAGTQQLGLPNVDGVLGLEYIFTVCPNPQCKKYAFTLHLYKLKKGFNNWDNMWNPEKLLHTWQLLPTSTAKTFPDYVPQQIRADYEEACLIRDLSPKASATLSRRCLQGMIRNYWGITKGTLKAEIDALKEKVDPLTWKAIDAARGIGNICAHMEKEINLIIDVDSEEAQQLIQLVEILIKDWYITRNEREEHLKAVAALAEAKKAQKISTAENSPKLEPKPAQKIQ